MRVHSISILHQTPNQAVFNRLSAHRGLLKADNFVSSCGTPFSISLFGRIIELSNNHHFDKDFMYDRRDRNRHLPPPF
jgi:hypothetical protein